MRGVIGPRLDADGALPDRRQEFIHAEIAVAASASPSLQARERQQRGIGHAVVELAQTRLDIAAQRHHFRSGRLRFIIACRRKDAVPIVAPRGSSRWISPCG